MTGIYAIVNTREPVRLPYGNPCPPALAPIIHRCYIGKSRDIEDRWKVGHLAYLRNGRHCCRSLLRAWQRDGPQAFVFLVLEEVSDDPVLLTLREGLYHAANPHGYRGRKV